MASSAASIEASIEASTAAVGDLTGWVKLWAEAYPAEHDDLIEPLYGARRLDHADRARLAAWRLGADHGAGHRRTLNLLEDNDQDWADELAERALACNDDLGAWLLARRIVGAGPALASAMLMVGDRDRFVVLDKRSWASLCELTASHALAGPGVDAQRLLHGANPARSRTWLAYLDACRALRDATGASLRSVDQALYQARGRMELPAQPG
jgi:hypothetical protein